LGGLSPLFKRGLKIKEVKLNFKPNELSPNGRIYNKESFFKKLDEKINSGIFIFEDSDDYTNTEVDIRKIIGFIDGYEVKEDELFFKVNPIEKDSILKCIDECTLSLIGSKDENGEMEVKKIICARPSSEYIFKTEEEIIKDYLKKLKDKKEE